jgi:SH3 domain-containing YSC84-like protein 1
MPVLAEHRREGVIRMKANNQTFPRSIAVVATTLLLFIGVSRSQDQDQNPPQGQSHDQNVNPKNPPAQNPNENPRNESDIQKRVHAAAGVLDDIMGVKDKAIPDKVMKDAKCVAVIPSTVKIAVGFGGEHGKGVATCRTGHGWSGPAPISLTGGSWGLQIGGEAVDIVLVVMNQRGMDDLLSSKFKIGGSASAAAGPVGRDAGADTDWKLKAEILTYSRARGVFAGVDLNGAVVSQDKDETRLLYGHMLSFHDILNGKVTPPPGSGSFVAAVTRYYERANGRKPATESGE